MSFPPLSEEFDAYQKCLTSTHEQASRRTSRTSTCSHTLSIHAKTASAVSFEDIMAETKTSVTVNIPSPTFTVGFFSFASSNSSPRVRKNPNIDKAEHSTSTTVSAEINPQYSSVNFGRQDEPKMELKVEKKSSLRCNDKDALKKRRFSQSVHVKLNCTPIPVILTYRFSEIVNEDIDPDNSVEVGANPVRLEVEGFSTSPNHNLQSSCFVVNNKYTAVTNGFKLCSLISVHTHMRVRNL